MRDNQANRMRGLSFCPITGNITTRMLGKLFLKMCELKQNENVGTKNKFKYPFCREVCRGTIYPKGLYLTDVEQREETVANAKEYSGKCEQCGKKANLRNNIGKSVCSTCGMIRCMVNVRPKAVIEVLREFGKMPETGSQAEGDNDCKEVIKVQLGRIAELKRKYDTTYAAVLAKEEEVEKLKAQLAKEEVGEALYLECQASETDDTVFDIALGIIEGSVKGVSVEQLRALRGA